MNINVNIQCVRYLISDPSESFNSPPKGHDSHIQNHYFRGLKRRAKISSDEIYESQETTVILGFKIVNTSK